jgi:hypothetical protein
MTGETVAQAEARADGLIELQRLPWREHASERTLRRDGRRWTFWSAGIVLTFGAPAALVLALNLWLFPVAALLLLHGLLILRLQAGRAVTSIHPLAPREGRDPGAGDAESVALGLLGDLLGHKERERMSRSGLALQRGRLGIWLLGERGALLVRPGGRRIFSYCVRVGEAEDLPAADRVAHLLLALREDEEGFATVANLGFSGAVWRCRMRMKARQRLALDEARAAAREMHAAA